jgi:hypothetical protein
MVCNRNTTSVRFDCLLLACGIDLLGCRCARGKKVLSHLKKNVRVDELSKWEHHAAASGWNKADEALRDIEPGLVTFVFSKHRDPAKDDPSEINGIDPLAEQNEFDEDFSDTEDNNNNNNNNNNEQLIDD